MASTQADSFQCGPFEVARNPDVRTFVDKLNRLREAVDSVRVQPGVGYTVNRSTNGTTLSIKTGGAGGTAAEEIFPFQVTTRVNNGAVQFRVHPESYVSGEYPENAGDWVETGLPSPLEVNVYAVLEVGVSENLEVQSVEIVSAEDLPPAVEPEGNGPQEKASLVIATLTPAGIVQNVRNHLQMVLVNSAGYPAIIPAYTAVA